MDPPNVVSDCDHRIIAQLPATTSAVAETRRADHKRDNKSRRVKIQLLSPSLDMERLMESSDSDASSRPAAGLSLTQQGMSNM